MTANTLESTRRSGFRLDRLLIAFVVGGVVALLAGVLVVFGFARAYDGRVVPGVQVGNADLGGLSRDAAIQRLDAVYGFLGDGTITIKTPVGAETMTFKDAGRGPDSAAMADAAMAIGHRGDAVSDAVDMVRTAARGEQIPLMVKVDPKAIATKIRQISLEHGLAPMNAQAIQSSGAFSIVHAVPGRGMDESSLAKSIVAQLTNLSAPAAISAEGEDVAIAPSMGDDKAQAAIDAANKMAADVDLVAGTEKWTIAGSKIATWVQFGMRTDGTYGPSIDLANVKTAVTEVSKKFNKAAVEPTLVTGKNGQAYGLSGGANGRAMNVDTTSQAVFDFINARVAGTAAANVAIASDAVLPKMANMPLQNMTLLGKWTTKFYPGEANGNGANIRIPARNINGTVVLPNEVFSFWKAVGPVDYAHGFKDGGVIKNGKSFHTGAIGGGICSASTTVFNAALKAGLEIIEKHQHDYYIDRYPMGLDATVYKSGGGTVFDMRFRNDTAYPIVIKGSSTYNTVTIQIMGVYDGRKVNIYQSKPWDIVKAKDTTVYVTTRKPGERYQAEYRTNGFKVYATRTVKDKNGNVIHSDRWQSNYVKVDGRLEIGVGSKSTPKPTPKPSTKTPAPKPSPSGAFAGFILVGGKRSFRDSFRRTLVRSHSNS